MIEEENRRQKQTFLTSQYDLEKGAKDTFNLSKALTQATISLIIASRGNSSLLLPVFGKQQEERQGQTTRHKGSAVKMDLRP